MSVNITKQEKKESVQGQGGKKGKKGDRQKKKDKKNHRRLFPKKKDVSGDPRLVKETATSVLIPNQTEAIVQSINLSAAPLIAIAAGYVANALQRGYLAFASDPSNPYFAWVYLATEIFPAYANSGKPAGTFMPYWIQCIGQGISPKAVTMKGGKIAYRYQITPPTAPEGYLDLGCGYTSSYMNFYVRSGTAPHVNNFPVGEAPATYTQALGEKAWQDMVSFMTRGDGHHSNNKNIPLQPIGKWAKNVSAFAFPTSTSGFCEAGGGVQFISNLEVPINAPLLAPIGAANVSANSGAASRAPSFAQVSGGSNVFIGGYMSHICPAVGWMAKRQPRFKFIDFKEFADVVGKWASKMVSSFFAGPDVALKLPGAECPLSLQEMQLLLRNEMMYVFGDSQPSVQGISPVFQQTGSERGWTTFTTGTNACGLQSVGMKLPLVIVENFKSLMMRPTFPTGRATDPQWYIPVIGAWVGDDLEPTDYEFSYTDESGEIAWAYTFYIPTFKRIEKKGKEEVVIKTAEVGINLADGTVGGDVIFINDSSRLQVLATSWNDWITKYSACSMSLTTVAKDLGVNICTSVCGTTHWTPSDVTKQKQMSDARLIEERFQHIHRTVAAKGKRLSPYYNREIVAYTYTNPMVSGADQIMQQWINPVNYISVESYTVNNTSFVKEQCLYAEPFSAVRSADGFSGIFLDTMHDSYASHMVKQAASPPDDWERFFTEMANKGQGGILSSLATAFGTAIGGPGVGSIAGGIVGAIPGLGEI